jgi:hypothetical protein
VFINLVHKAAALPISNSEILVFGGRLGPLYNSQENGLTYIINLDQETVEFCKSSKVKGDFQMHNFALNEPSAAIFSGEGILIHVDMEKKNIWSDNLKPQKPENNSKYRCFGS